MVSTDEPDIDTGAPDSEKNSQDPARGTLLILTKMLAGNTKKIRDKGLKRIKMWLSLRSQGNFCFTEEDMMTIWTGLYYSMWMSDLPLVQEELAESISSLVHCFNNNHDGALLFIKCFAVTIDQGWATLDQHRLDKFAMFVRRFLRQSLMWLANLNWTLTQVKQLIKIYHANVLGEKITLGFKFHFVEIFLEELAKASKGQLAPDAVVAFLQPFARTAALTGDGRMRLQCESLFRQLIKQTDVALKFEDKFEAWKTAGFPGGNVNTIELDSDGEEEIVIEESAQEGPSDPRAGSVHVTLPQIQFPAKRLSKLMKTMSTLPQASVKGRRLMLALSESFKGIEKGKYPFAFDKVCDDEHLNLNKLVAQKAKQEVMAEVRRERKKKSKKQKKLNSSENSSTGSPKYSVKKKKKKMEKSPKKVKKVEKRRDSLKFVVTAAEEVDRTSPVGAKKRKHSDVAELDLPSGWIVEEIPEGPLKKRAVVVGNGEVIAASVGKQATPVAVTEMAPTSSDSSPVGTPKRSQNERRTSPKKTIEMGVDAIAESNKTTPPKVVPAFLAHAMSKVNKGLKTSPTASATPSLSGIKTPVASPAALLAKETMDAINGTKSGRRISFNLAKNMAQEKVEWLEQIERSPQIPFDAAVCPRRSALKQGLPPSPINPFYAMKLGLTKKT